MSVNPFARSPACARCHDIRTLTRSVRAHMDTDLIPCPACGSLAPEEYERFLRDAWIRSQAPPSICEVDLSPDEFKAFRRMREECPHASKITVLTWIEGQRYDPAKDPQVTP